MHRSRVALMATMFASVSSMGVASAAPPLVVEEKYFGRGTVAEAGTMVPEKDKDIFFGRYTLEPGASTGWHDDPGAVLVVVNRGTVTLVEGASCATRSYATGQAAVAQPGQHLLRNDGKTATEFIASHVSLPVGGPTPYLESDSSGPVCAVRTGQASVEVLGRGPFDSRGHGNDRFFGDGSRPIEVKGGLDVTVQEFTFGPRWQSGWHNHPGPAVGVVTKGYGKLYEGHDGHCEVEEIKAGDGLVFFTDHAHWATNEGDGDGAVLTAYVNVPQRTKGVIPTYENSPDSIEFRSPPASCPVPVAGVNAG